MSLRSELTIHYVHILSLMQAILHSFNSYCLLLVICLPFMLTEDKSMETVIHATHCHLFQVFKERKTIYCHPPKKIMSCGVFPSNRITWCQKDSCIANLRPFDYKLNFLYENENEKIYNCFIFCLETAYYHV